MKLLSAISLLLLASSYSPLVQARPQPRDVDERHVRRRGKKDSGDGGNSAESNVDGDVDRNGLYVGGLIIEPGAGSCIPFSDTLIQDFVTASTYSSDHDMECNTNSCGASGSPGCCRYHTNLLRCDLDDEFPTQPVRKRSIFATLGELFYTHTIVLIPCPSHISAFATNSRPYEQTSRSLFLLTLPLLLKKDRIRMGMVVSSSSSQTQMHARSSRTGRKHIPTNRSWTVRKVRMLWLVLQGTNATKDRAVPFPFVSAILLVVQHHGSRRTTETQPVLQVIRLRLNPPCMANHY
jgi:hypothetical protein